MQIGIAPASIVGRYSCPYNNIAKPQWWDTQKSGGCIVEQATHFVDLMRYLSGGNIVQESIQAVAVGPDMPLKQMPAHPQAEHLVSWYMRTHCMPGLVPHTLCVTPSTYAETCHQLSIWLHACTLHHRTCATHT